MAVWVQVESPSERVNNAVEELAVNAGDGEGVATGLKNPQENDGAKSSATDAEAGISICPFSVFFRTTKN